MANSLHWHRRIHFSKVLKYVTSPSGWLGLEKPAHFPNEVGSHPYIYISQLVRIKICDLQPTNQDELANQSIQHVRSSLRVSLASPLPGIYTLTIILAFFRRLIPRRSFEKTRNQLDSAETSSADVSTSELLQRQRANRLSPQDVLGSTPYHLVGGVSHYDPHAFIPALPYRTPFYSAVELPDRTNVVIGAAQNAPSSTSLPDLQADSSHGRACLDTKFDGKNLINDSAIFDHQPAFSSFYTFYNENADARVDMPSLQHDISVPHTTSPSTPSSSLNSQIFSIVSSGSPVSSSKSPMSAVDVRTSWPRTAAHIEDSDHAWTPLSSRFEQLELEETHLQSPLARPRANTAPTSDSISYCGYSSKERRQDSFQIPTPGAEAKCDYGMYLGGPPTETRIQVEELLDLVVIINREWMEGLIPDHELYRRCSSLSAPTLFGKGITTLKTWVGHGQPGKTFEEVFSFMHVALAATCLLHRKDVSSSRDAFFQYALELQETLIDGEERLLFMRAISHWQWLPGQQSTYVSVLVSGDR